jgi:enoyl-CoA hydratase/carnithine racemase
VPSRFDREPAPPGAVRLRFHPSDRRGVLDERALDALFDACAAVAAEPAVRLVALEGAREDLFAAGADLETIAALTPESALAFADRGRRAIGAWESLDATTVAVVRGSCFGGALDLVLASDIVLAFPGARFAHPGAQRGIVTGWGGTARAGRRLSGAALTALFADPEPIPSHLAHANGLADFLLEEGQDVAPLLARWAGPEGEPLRALKRLTRETEGLAATQAHIVADRLSRLV